MEDEAIHAKLDGLKELMQSQFKTNAQQHEALKEGLNEKAGKWVETLSKGMIGTILMTVLGAVLALVISGGAAIVAYTIVRHVV